MPEKPKSEHLFILILLTLLSLGPFAGKAFHIDDPLFLWTARHIQSHPADFYGFSVNWTGTEEPMSVVTKNPPLAAYYIALMAFVLGWSEWALHLAFLLPGVAAVLGTYFLARRFCRRPVVASVAVLVSPVFLVSSTSVMCDTMMLALWVWTLVLWLRGLEHDELATLILAAFLSAACALTKYYGMSLVPLLFVYSLVRTRRLGRWAFCLLVPVFILGGYQGLTHTLYGRGLLLDAASFATGARSYLGATVMSKGLVSLAFTGGCLAPVLFYAPFLWRWRGLVGGMIACLLLILILSAAGTLGEYPLRQENDIRWFLVIQIGLWAAAGIGLLGLAFSDLHKSRDACSILLFLWFAGTFIFAGFVNWTVNGRSILPMAPALGILLVRRIDQWPRAKGFGSGKLMWPLIPAAVVALLASWSDYRLAEAGKDAAAQIYERHGKGPAKLWFQGHWGFQYYMEESGARPFDNRTSRLGPGEIMAVPRNNTGTRPMRTDRVRLLETIRFSTCRWLATMQFSTGAGYYADIWGPLPFALGPVPSEDYDIYLLGP